MTTTNTFAATQRSFRIGAQATGQYFSLPELAKTYPNVNRLPVSGGTTLNCSKACWPHLSSS